MHSVRRVARNRRALRVFTTKAHGLRLRRKRLRRKWVKETGTIMIRILTIALAVSSAAAFGTKAQAQNYPWCSIYSGDMGGAQNCGFVSFQQCMANVSGIGGFCVQNDWYRPPPGSRASSARR